MFLVPYFKRDNVLGGGGRLRLGNSFIWGQSGLLMEFRCVKIRLVLLNEGFCNPTPRGGHFQYIRGGSDVIRVYVSLSTCELM